ncbi:MAG: class I SAM-dependent methyltransferase [Gammaproteobacteria bacterium]
MNSNNTISDTPSASEADLKLVCPLCRDDLIRNEDHIQCSTSTHPDCPGTFKLENGFPDLIIGDRFDDASDDTCLCYEENSNRYTTEHYWIPTFKKLFEGLGRPPRILSLGCGTGTEVDMLNDAGFDCWGIDNGNRTQVWPNRTAHAKLMLANGMHLPFSSGSFDAVFCGCVFPHVGVVGDSNIVAENGLEDRQNLADEMTRVLKTGGKIIVSSPNRYFPFDIFHGRQPGSYKPVFNPPGSRFLFSVGDYSNMFKSSGCSQASARPITGYWGFIRSKNSFKGALFAMPVRFIFWLVSTEPFKFLRRSPLPPWVVVEVTK